MFDMSFYSFVFYYLWLFAFLLSYIALSKAFNELKKAGMEPLFLITKLIHLQRATISHNIYYVK